MVGTPTTLTIGLLIVTCSILLIFIHICSLWKLKSRPYLYPVAIESSYLGSYLIVSLQWTVSFPDPSLDDVKFESVSVLAEVLLKQVTLV